MDSSTITLWTGPFQIEWDFFFILLQYFIEIPVYNANSVDPDRMPRSAAFDLNQHFPMSLLLGIKGLQDIYDQSGDSL